MSYWQFNDFTDILRFQPIYERIRYYYKCSRQCTSWYFHEISHDSRITGSNYPGTWMRNRQGHISFSQETIIVQMAMADSLSYSNQGSCRRQNGRQTLRLCLTSQRRRGQYTFIEVVFDPPHTALSGGGATVVCDDVGRQLLCQRRITGLN